MYHVMCKSVSRMAQDYIHCKSWLEAESTLPANTGEMDKLHNEDDEKQLPLRRIKLGQQ